jgi:C1A family cysteine protease
MSRLFHYYATRLLEGTPTQDSGATIRDTIKAGAQYGLVAETSWPYDVTKFAVNPPATLWATAKKQVISSYHSIADGDLESMKAALASGSLVEFGFDVYDAFLSDQVAATGLVCRPTAAESLQGGHAVVLVGYDDNKVMPDKSKGAFLVRNSWGTGWGLQGYFWMAYNYVGDKSLASDFWVVVSEPL